MFCSQTAAANSENRQELAEEPQIEQEKLFEKPLTPSDVGKLNRLVIPKQHAEKYFPLNGASVADSGEKGLLLGFEDEGGKPWRFRYSYWNSSQSYVLTKGWSRFVKEKRLDAGDVVLFARHRRDCGRFFIGWRRRNSEGGTAGRWSGVVLAGHPYPNPNQHQAAGSVAYLQTDHCSTTAAVEKSRSMSMEQTRRSGISSKRLRLFGVNLEWPEEDESETSTATATSSQGDHHHTWI